MSGTYLSRGKPFRRALWFEGLEQRLPLAVDLDDSLSEARLLGSVSTTAKTVNARIDVDTDVDLYRFTVVAGQTVDFDIDTPFNGPGGLGSYLRLFDSTGQQLAFNNNGAAPGETQVGFDAYLRHTFAAAGTYYIGVSNWMNASYDPVSGERDTSGGTHPVGDYTLLVQGLPTDTDDTLTEATSLGVVRPTPTAVSARIDPDIDVDLYRFTVAADQTVDFDIDTPFNGPGGLGSVLRLFDATGQQLAFNNNAAAPGETQVGFDAYLRHTFVTAGTYFIGVSNWINAAYDPITGNGDSAGGQHAVGDYQLIVNTAPIDAPSAFAAASNFEPAARDPLTGPAAANDSLRFAQNEAPAPFQAPPVAAAQPIPASTMPVVTRSQESAAAFDAFFAELDSEGSSRLL